MNGTRQILIIPIIVTVLSACGDYYGRSSPQMTVQEGLDTIWISNEPNHGYYEINDTLTLFSGWPLLDNRLCNTMDHRSEPIWSTSNEPYRCSISDLYPPFQVFKRAHSDTIVIIKDGKVIRFKMGDRI